MNRFLRFKLEQPSTEQNKPIKVLIFKFSGLSSLMCFSALNLEPKYLKKNRIYGENVKYCSHFQNKTNYMTPRSSHNNKSCMALVSPDHPYHHHHHHYLHLHFVICYVIFLFNIFIVTMFHDCFIVIFCALRNLFTVKPFNMNIIVNQFKPIIK